MEPQLNNKITINKTGDNEFDFNLDVEGADAANLKVRLVLAIGEGMYLTFKCNKDEDGAWHVKVPPISKFDINPTDYMIEAILDGHYFNILQGRVVCVEESRVKVSSNTNIKNKSSEAPKAEEKKEEKKTDKETVKEPIIKNLTKKEEEKKERKQTKETLDNIVSKILHESNNSNDDFIKSLLKKKTDIITRKGNKVVK